nr:glycosyltransferase family 4 protein [Youngiibacter multivorans]
MILTATEETSRLIPKKYHNKIKIFQAIGLSDQFLYPEPQFKQNKKCRFLMVGRMLKLKGFEIGIDAFVSALNTGINAELVILGDGNSEHLRTLKKKSETVHEAIKFTEQVEYKKMRQFYQEFDVLLNCSMRDSGGFVVIEAMGCGLPVICIDTAGPKVNTTIDSAIKIKPANYSVMKKNLKEAIINMANNPELRETMGRAAYNRAINKFAASNRTKIMNEFYNQIITK